MKIAPLLLILGLTAGSVPAQETMRVAIPLFPTAAFPVLVGNDRGFFQKEGLIVEPIRINSAPTTYQALISGDVHAAVGAPTGLLPSHAQGADVVALGSWDNLVPYVWVTREKSPTSVSCGGKRSGLIARVANLGSSFMFFCRTPDSTRSRTLRCCRWVAAPRRGCLP
jgi:ABC-type nitrate/sulfonate/bicarbonate transport system substrate-binding protein